MSDHFLPEPPDPVVVSRWMGQVRAWVPVLLMFGIAVPEIPDGKLQVYVSLILVTIGLGTADWSWIEKRWQQRAANDVVVDSAVESARIGAPVTVKVLEVTPVGQPNIGISQPVAVADVATATLSLLPAGITSADLNKRYGVLSGTGSSPRGSSLAGSSKSGAAKSTPPRTGEPH